MGVVGIVDELLLGVALAMDCFAVSFATGLQLKRFSAREMLFPAFMFGLFQAAMPFFGWLLTVYLGDKVGSYDHWIAFSLLVFLGARMVREQFTAKESETHNMASLYIVLTLAIATSIDALAVGVSFTCMGVRRVLDIIEPITVIGVCSFLLSLLGNMTGIYVGKRFKLPMEMIGGLILIAIGTKILIEHLSEGN